ncbi:hypothetical protein Anapl_18033 [Anas platyrhynchos]|uniref:Uncharacterized protein n=1 Tax=Anas platyrhynchos TaxID=8839 RepID=R0LP13_ANAPL|nr:hypothetical protein Anapl_18033 [Anas platyrhynchos]
MMLTNYYSFSETRNGFIDQIPQEEEKACQKPHTVSVHHLHYKEPQQLRENIFTKEEILETNHYTEGELQTEDAYEDKSNYKMKCGIFSQAENISTYSPFTEYLDPRTPAKIPTTLKPLSHAARVELIAPDFVRST